MPEGIIRSYLKNPFRYNSTTLCCGCKGYVQDSEVFWVETRQRVSEYMQVLRQENPSAPPNHPPIATK